MATSDGIIVTITPIDDGVIVVPNGDIDFSRSPTLRVELMRVLEDQNPPRLVIDLSAVGYMDSSGVATLVETMQCQRKQGHKLVLCNMQPKVKSIFQIARLDLVFMICDSTGSAVQA